MEKVNVAGQASFKNTELSKALHVPGTWPRPWPYRPEMPQRRWTRGQQVAPAMRHRSPSCSRWTPPRCFSYSIWFKAWQISEQVRISLALICVSTCISTFEYYCMPWDIMVGSVDFFYIRTKQVGVGSSFCKHIFFSSLFQLFCRFKRSSIF